MSYDPEILSRSAILLLRRMPHLYDASLSQLDGYNPANPHAFPQVMSVVHNELGISFAEMSEHLDISADKLERWYLDRSPSTREEREKVHDYGLQRLTGTWQPPNS